MNSKLNKLFRDIKEVKIQGATNVAKAAIKAYSLSPKKSTKKKLESLRPTEPALRNALDMLEKNQSSSQVLSHFSEAQEKINNYTLKIIRDNDVIFTHCHSTNVVKALINAKKKGKKFQVYNTETRPLFQGRKTAKQLSKAKIKVTTFVDSAAAIALAKKQGTRKSTKIFLGADAILRNGDVVNKVGSGMFSQIAKLNKIKVYIIADSWKFSKENLKLEKRSYKEVWDDSPSKKIKIQNPSFEKIPAKLIKSIVSELGIFSPKKFVKKARKSI